MQQEMKDVKYSAKIDPIVYQAKRQKYFTTFQNIIDVFLIKLRP
jgi:hypothetical protein